MQQIFLWRFFPESMLIEMLNKQLSFSSLILKDSELRPMFSLILLQKGEEKAMLLQKRKQVTKGIANIHCVIRTEKQNFSS